MTDCPVGNQSCHGSDDDDVVAGDDVVVVVAYLPAVWFVVFYGGLVIVVVSAALVDDVVVAIVVVVTSVHDVDAACVVSNVGVVYGVATWVFVVGDFLGDFCMKHFPYQALC